MHFSARWTAKLECIDWSSMVVRVLDFDDPDDNGDRGLRCISASFTSMGTDAYEQTYSCVGTYVTAFPGQHVTILERFGQQRLDFRNRSHR